MRTMNKDLIGKWAYTAIVHESGYTVGRADYGIGGYTPSEAVLPSYAEAKALADKLNEERGLTKAEAFEIVMNTMR